MRSLEINGALFDVLLQPDVPDVISIPPMSVPGTPYLFEETSLSTLYLFFFLSYVSHFPDAL